MQAAAAIFRVLSPGQPPKQRQAAAPRAILARIVSITRGFAIQFRQGVAEPAVGLFIETCLRQACESRQRQAISDCQCEVGLRSDHGSKDRLAAEFASDLLDNGD
jgi:hypothetical protein